jgi:hypothetical protein
MPEGEVVMATIYWDGGAGDNVFSTAGNWSSDTSPTDGDICVLGEDPADGSDDIAGGDMTALGTLTLVVGPKWTGNIGSSDALKLKLTRIEYTGSSSLCHIEADSSVVVAECLVSGTGVGEMPFRLTGTGTITSLQVTGNRGKVEISGTRSVTTVELIGEGVSEVDMSYSGICSGTTARCNGGLLKFNGNYNNVEVSGRGVVEISGTPTVSTLEIYGGTCKWICTGTTSAISTSLKVFSGLFDGASASAATVTVAGATVYEQGTIDERNGLESFVWSGGIDSRGGTIYPDAGRTLTVG